MQIKYLIKRIENWTGVIALESGGWRLCDFMESQAAIAFWINRSRTVRSGSYPYFATTRNGKRAVIEVVPKLNVFQAPTGGGLAHTLTPGQCFVEAMDPLRGTNRWISVKSGVFYDEVWRDAHADGATVQVLDRDHYRPDYNYVNEVSGQLLAQAGASTRSPAAAGEFDALFSEG